MSLDNAIAFRCILSFNRAVARELQEGSAGLAGDAADEAVLALAARHGYPCTLAEWRESADVSAEQRDAVQQANAGVLAKLVERLNEDLITLSDDLVSTRVLVVERSEQSERLAQDLTERSAELVRARELVVERSQQAEILRQNLDEMSAELVRTRELVVERSQQAEGVIEELAKSREQLAERTKQVERLRRDLSEMSAELKLTREVAVGTRNKRTS